MLKDGFLAHLYLAKKKRQQTNFGRYNRDFYTMCIFRKADVVRLAKILLPLSRHIDKLKQTKLILKIKNKKWQEVKEEVEKLIKKRRK